MRVPEAVSGSQVVISHRVKGDIIKRRGKWISQMKRWTNITNEEVKFVGSFSRKLRVQRGEEVLLVFQHMVNFLTCHCQICSSRIFYITIVSTSCSFTNLPTEYLIHHLSDEVNIVFIFHPFPVISLAYTQLGLPLERSQHTGKPGLF